MEDKDETEEEKELDDSTYETEEEPTPETESDEDIDSDKNEPSRLVCSTIQKRFEASLESFVHSVNLSTHLIFFVSGGSMGFTYV